MKVIISCSTPFRMRNVSDKSYRENQKTFCVQFGLLFFSKNRAVYEIMLKKYRVSIKSFPVYKHLLQENYMEYKHFFCNITINT